MLWQNIIIQYREVYHYATKNKNGTDNWRNWFGTQYLCSGLYFIGICGPLVSLLAGGVAGFLAAQQEKLPTKNDGAKAGAMAGGIAGALVIIGQIIGGISALAIMQATGAQLPFGTIPSTGDPSGMVIYQMFRKAPCVLFSNIITPSVRGHRAHHHIWG